jgi:hypothetical protein
MNTAMLKVKGTDYSLPDNYEMMETEMISSSEDDLKINFMYSKNWPTFIEIQPSQGDILSSDSFSNGGGYMQMLTQFMCLNSYQFSYIMKYPILISITDKKGNSFEFATEVIIDHNQPRVDRLNPEPLEDISSAICNFPVSTINAGTYTFDNDGNSIALKGVDISFKCSPKTCPIIQATKTSEVIIQTPACYNGILIGTKQGYYEGRQIQTIEANKTYYSDLYLEPIYNKNIKVKIIDKFSGEIRDPYDSEEITIQFSEQDQNYNTYFSYPDNKQAELIQGRYTIKANLFRKSTWSITTQSKTIDHCITQPEATILGAMGLSKKTSCQEISVPSMELDQVMTGGEEFNYTLERKYLADSNSLIMYVMADNIPSTMEDIADIQTKISVNNEHPLFRNPEYE